MGHRTGAILFILATGAAAPAQDAAPDSSDLVDGHLIDLWKRKGVARGPRADETEFLRRLCIDLVGEVPTPAEIREFRASEHPEKRRRKVDELLRSPWFARSWAERMTNFLIGYPRPFDSFTDRTGMTKWLHDRLRVPGARWDEMARDLLTSSSEGANVRTVGFFTQFAEFNERGYRLRIEQVAGRVSNAFLGRRLQCCQCHDHPADRFTQEDFAGLAAFFARTSFGADTMGSLQLSDRKKASAYTFEGLKGDLRPRYLDGSEPRDDAWRAELARLITEDPQFARAFVNRVWAWLFGKGLVDPLDDMNDGRKPVAPELLDALAADFASRGFNIRHLVRTLCNSDAYGLSSKRGPDDDGAAEAYFARARVRPMTPEQLFQSISRATDLLEARQDDDAILALLGGQNPTGEQKKYFVVRRWFIDMLVKTSDESAITNFSAYTANIQQILHALNKDLPLFAGTKGDTGGRLQKLLERRGDEEIVTELFLATVSRPPTSRETARCLMHVRQAADRRKGFEELYWSLLNTDEFIFNH
jgi:hypothetical protein